MPTFVSRLLIVVGFLGVCGAMLWWREFYGEIGQFFGTTDLPVECIYKMGGTCGLVSEAASIVTTNAYDPGLFWISIVLLLTGIILSVFSGGERSDVYLTHKRDRDYRPLDRDDRQDPYL